VLGAAVEPKVLLGAPHNSNASVVNRAQRLTSLDQMIRSIQLVVSPFETWIRIETQRRNALAILFLFLLPLLLLGVALEGYSLLRWGDTRGEFGRSFTFTQAQVLQYAGLQAGLLLGTIILGAAALFLVARGSQVRTDFAACFTVMSYGCSPLLLARALDAIPRMNTWVCWGIGAALSASLLYHGVGVILRPDQTKGFGVYLMAVIIMLVASGLSHFVATSVLYGVQL
jgi:hypothetical protein